jgi:hypothetical protein
MASFLMNAVRKNPLIFNAVTGGFLCASSDAVAQHWEEHADGGPPTSDVHSSSQEPSRSRAQQQQQRDHLLAPSLKAALLLPSIDWWRLAGAGCIGSFFGGILYPAAYARLDALFVGTQWKTVLVKSIVEIATVGILVNTISLTVRGLVRGDQDLGQVTRHVSARLGTVTQNDFFVWLPYNIVAFSIIPAILRPTTTAAMEASWQTYISLCAHDYPTEPESVRPTANNPVGR